MSDFSLEKRLQVLSPGFHMRMRDSIVTLQKTLESFFSWFPDYTDHSALHSMDVLEFSNIILGDQVDRLSAEECYVLIMSCYLHDVGMGIRRMDYEEFVKRLDLKDYNTEHPDADVPQIIRDFHNEFSGMFIRKYRDLFDIPSEELTFAIIQVSRGHRKTDLYDKQEYPDIRLNDREMIRTPILAAVIRLADEMDVGADRNPEILFDTSKLTRQRDIDAFETHKSIRTVEVRRDVIVLHVMPRDKRYEELIHALAVKLQKTLDYCRRVVKERSDFRITQKDILVQMERKIGG